MEMDISTPASATLSDLMNSRYSCRGFLPKPVEREVIEKILLMSQRTASWCNSQAWQVAITEAPATDRLRKAMESEEAQADSAFDIPAPTEYRGVYKDRRRECGLQLYESVGVMPGDRVASAKQAQENFRFFGAPHVALITTEVALGPYGAVDCGGYVQNFMLAARSLGVASIAQAALAMKSEFLRKWFEIPDNRQVVCGISFGYEDREHPANSFRTRRAPMSEVVQWVRS